MANIPFKSITFPGLPNKYTVPEISSDLMTAGKAADAKATGDALALKADKSTTYTKTEVDQMIEDVKVETDTTLEIDGAPADAAETGRQIGLLKADLGDLVNNRLNFIQIEEGTIDDSGHFIANATRLRTVTKMYHDFSVTCPDGFLVFKSIVFNAETDAFVSVTAVNAQTANITVASGTYVMLTFRKTDNSTIYVHELKPDLMINNILNRLDTTDYTCAEQNLKLTETIKALAPMGEVVNLFDADSITTGKFWATNGGLNTSANGAYSDQWIAVDPSKTYSFTSGDVVTKAYFLTYDANKNVIERLNMSTNTGVSFGENAYYVRLSYYNVPFPDNYMLVEGTLPSSNYNYGYYAITDSTLRNDKLPANAKAVGDALASLNKCKLKYTALSSGDTVGQIDLYVPNSNGYTRYQILHNVYVTANCDIWRVHQIQAVDSSLANAVQFTTYGELEMAIKINGRSDYIGGRTHGDEISDSVAFIIDGKVVNITTLTSMTEFDNFRIVETSTMYDPNDGTTVVGKHGKEHYFDRDGLTLSQSVQWLASVNVTEAYLSMLIGAQSTVKSMYTDISFVPETISTETSRTYYKKAKTATLYGESAKITEKLEILNYPTGLSGGDQLEMRVTAGSNNKLYAPVVMDSNGYITTLNELWKSKTKFTFDTCA